MDMNKKGLSLEKQNELLNLLKERFEQNIHRHENMDWNDIETKLKNSPEKLWSLNEMESTEGEPDVIGYDQVTGEYIFCDCSKESPKGRRKVCYDREALEARKKYKPENNAIDMANDMGIEVLTEEQYRELQNLEPFDIKTQAGFKHPTLSEISVGLCSAIIAMDKFSFIIMVRTLIMACEDFCGLLRV